MTSRLPAVLLSVALAVGSLFSMASPAAAADYYCNGPSVTPRSGPIKVAAGARCYLTSRDSVTTITVMTNGFLDLNGAKVTSVGASGAVRIANSTVTGQVMISSVASGPSVICSSIIGGDLWIYGNRSSVSVSPSYGCPISSFVGGSVYAVDNRAPVTVHAVSIMQSLVCTGNTPVPTIGAVTTLYGSRKGQCA